MVGVVVDPSSIAFGRRGVEAADGDGPIACFRLKSTETKDSLRSLSLTTWSETRQTLAPLTVEARALAMPKTPENRDV